MQTAMGTMKVSNNMVNRVREVACHSLSLRAVSCRKTRLQRKEVREPVVQHREKMKYSTVWWGGPALRRAADSAYFSTVVLAVRK